MAEKRLVVVGAGPAGIAAAFAAIARGFDVTVIEKQTVGAALYDWGATKLFSPLGQTLPSLRALLGNDWPGDDAIMTGRELVERVLVPLAWRLTIVHGEVRGIARDRLLRGEYAGNPLRSERAFRVLVATNTDGEKYLEADRVLDARGVALPVGIGPGGIMAIGEVELGARFIRSLGELERASLTDRRVLLVGSGHSAAHALALLATSRVTWLCRRAHARPIEEVANDPLSERARVATAANALATAPPPWLTVERRAYVAALHNNSDAIRVTLLDGRTLDVDAIVALHGQRPDHAPIAALNVEICARTEGAQRLQAALANVTDCLNVPPVPALALTSGEPGYALIGRAAYGRSRAFLLSTAHRQTEQTLEEWATS